MNDLRKAAVTALEALNVVVEYLPDEYFGNHFEDIKGLEKALAQPEQLVVGGDDLPTLTKWTPQRKPLTEEQVLGLIESASIEGLLMYMDLCRAIEKAHGIGGEHE